MNTGEEQVSNGITRRGLAKGIAALTATVGAAQWTGAEARSTATAVTGASARKTSVSSSWQQVHPGVWRATLGKPEAYTPVGSRAVAAKQEAFAHLPVVDVAPLAKISGSSTVRGFRVELPLEPQEEIFGLGLQFLSFNQRGKKKTMRVNADPKMDTGDSHAPVPFYVTTRGVGVLVDTARYATFYLGNARPKPTMARSLQAGASVDPVYTHSLADKDEASVIVEVPEAAGVDVYVFAGPAMQDAVRRYNLFSGGGVLPPEWALGFWYRMDSHSTEESVVKFAAELRERKIPCDVLGLEPGWQSHAYSCTLAWDEKRFADPAAMIRRVASQHYKMNLWEHAYVHPASPLFSSLEPHAGDMGVWGGLVPDFAGEQARTLFGEYHGKAFIEQGISGFKLDECDNSDYTGGWGYPEFSSFPSGVDGEQMHSVFGQRYQDAIWQAYQRRKQQTFGLVRSSGALAAPYPFVLYSDLYEHRDYIRALVNSGFSGLLWCPEVRDAVSEEDLIRRLQSVVYSPLAMINGWYIKNPPWKQLNRKLNNADQLLPEWQTLEARCRAVIAQRMALVPYLQAAFAQYSKDGTPPFRALVMDDPGDERLYAVDDQYMIGDRMMVAPLFAGEKERKVVLPKGAWHNFWTGVAVEGGQELVVACAQVETPVYVRANSLVPWAEVGLYAASEESRRITVRIYGDGSRPFALGSEADQATLYWNGREGRVEGSTQLRVQAWQKIVG